MNPRPPDSRAVAFSGRVYRFLMMAYPRAHREEYGGPMAQLFRDQSRDAWNRRRIWGVLWLWLHVLPDLLKTALWERLTNQRERKNMPGKNIVGAPPVIGSPVSNWIAMFITVFVSIFLLVVITATIFTFLSPEVYSSTARIGVEETMTKGALDHADSPGGREVTYSSKVQAVFAALKSDVILDKVIDVLELDKKWQHKFNSPTKLKYLECRELLKHMVDFRSYGNTTMLSITVYSDDRMEAAAIANTMAEVYQSYERDKYQKLAVGSLQKYNELKDQLKSELADKTGDPKMVDAKITETIARAGQLYSVVNAGIPGEQVEIIERAYPGPRPVRPNKPLNITLGIFIGAVLGFVVAGGVVLLGIKFRRLQPTTPAQSPA